MSMGAPVVSANCPSGPSEIIQDGINGILVPVEDIDALSTAMSELMSKPELRNRLGAKATEVRHVYQQDLIMGLWEDCLLAGSPRSLCDNAYKREV